MKLKTCTCGLKVTTRNALKVIRDDGLGTPVLYFTCPSCKSTMILVPKRRLEAA